MVVVRPLPNLQLRALLLSLLALAVPALGAFAFPEGAREYEALLWLLALVPAFLLSYQRGWRGIATALALGMATLSTTYAVAMGAGRGMPDMLPGVIIFYLGITLAVGVLAERMHRDRARETEAAAALLDALTALPNARHAELFLEREFAAAVRGRPLTVVLFDFDDFDAYNVQHGRGAGDGVLRAFATLLRTNTRRMNLAARWRGDSFLCILGGSDEEGALIFAGRTQERLRAADSMTTVPSLSAGIAAYRSDIDDIAELVRRAGLALHEARAAGGDRVRIHGRSLEELRGTESIAAAIARARAGYGDLGPGADDRYRMRTACVLLEDSERRRRMAAQLEQLGFTVREDVLDGLFPLTSEYDVVAIDVTNASGRDLVRAVRERYPTTRLLGVLEPTGVVDADLLGTRVDGYWHERMPTPVLNANLRELIVERQRMVDVALHARQLREEVHAREREGRAALEESEARYRAAVHALSDVVVRTDRELRITFVNPAWSRLTGRVLDEAVGTELAAYIHEEDRAALMEELVEVLEGTRPAVRRDVRISGDAAPARSVSVAMQPLRSYGSDIEGVTGTMTPHAPEPATPTDA
ncbi:MAG: diguanylate cyclase domain-containing protein [Longimicrobiales bacterium]